PARFGFVRRMIEKSKYFLITTIFNTFPLPQKAGFRSSFAYAGESVDRGYTVLVFPEGERTRAGNMGPFRAGIGILASNLGIPVVPLRLTGLYQFKGRHIAPPNAITVWVGPPVIFPPGTDATTITQELESRVAALGENC
ncbi:MAG: lysophospholipid acyltransferase family protein, partial [Terriglobia bacterium]